MGGPAGMTTKTGALPQGGEGPLDEQFALKDKESGTAIAYAPYRIETADGKMYRGMTDAEGRTLRIFTGKAQSLKVFLR